MERDDFEILLCSFCKETFPSPTPTAPLLAPLVLHALLNSSLFATGYKNPRTTHLPLVHEAESLRNW